MEETISYKDKEIVNLTQEMLKVKVTAEKEFKKATKAYQTQVVQNNTRLTTGGSGDHAVSNGSRLNQTFSFDPYSSGKKNLNNTMIIENTYDRASKLNRGTLNGFGATNGNPFGECPYNDEDYDHRRTRMSTVKANK